MKDLNEYVNRGIAQLMQRDKYVSDGVPELVSEFCQRPRRAMSDFELSQWETAFRAAVTMHDRDPRSPRQHGKLYGKYLQIVRDLRGQLCAA